MKIALNGATTMRADLATDIQAAKAAAFDYLEIWADKLRNFLRHRTSHELKDLIARTGVPPLEYQLDRAVTFRDSAAYESIKQQCAELSEIAATIQCPFIVVVPGGSARRCHPRGSYNRIRARPGGTLRHCGTS